MPVFTSYADAEFLFFLLKTPLLIFRYNHNYNSCHPFLFIGNGFFFIYLNRQVYPTYGISCAFAYNSSETNNGSVWIVGTCMFLQSESVI